MDPAVAGHQVVEPALSEETPSAADVQLQGVHPNIDTESLPPTSSTAPSVGEQMESTQQETGMVDALADIRDSQTGSDESNTFTALKENRATEEADGDSHSPMQLSDTQAEYAQSLPSKDSDLTQMETKEQVINEMKRILIKTGYNLASEMGYSIFIKVIDITGSSEYYGTKDLLQDYHGSGLKVGAKDVPLSGRTALPIRSAKLSVNTAPNDGMDDDDDGDDNDNGDEDYRPPSPTEQPSDSDTADDNHEGKAKLDLTEATSIIQDLDSSQEVQREVVSVAIPAHIAETKGDSEANRKSAVSEAILEQQKNLQVGSPAESGRRRKRKAEHPMKIKVKLPPKKRKISVTMTTRKKNPVRRGRGRPPKKVAEKKPKPVKAVKEPKKPVEKKKTVEKKDPSQPKERKAHARLKKLTCKHCEKQFRDKWHLDRHERSHTGEKPFVCGDCGKAFSSSTHFKEHQMRHQGKRDWVCELCSRDFYFRADLQEHIKKVHASGKGHACQYCRKAFSQESQLKLHEEAHIPEEEKVLVCIICGHKFAHVISFSRHHRNEHGAASHLCPFCDKGYPSFGNLKNHLSSHAGTKPFQCDQCGKTYSSEGGLKWHQVIHAKGKTFECSMCDMKFFRNIDLTKHLTVHTTEKQYVCEMCGAQFKRIHSLTKHQQRHMGIVLRPYKCGDCGKAFDTTAHLKRHVSIHSGDKPHECPECNKRFNRKDNLRTHMKVHGVGNQSTPKKVVRPKIPKQKVRLSRPTDDSDTEVSDDSYTSESETETPITQPPPPAHSFHSYSATSNEMYGQQQQLQQPQLQHMPEQPPHHEPHIPAVAIPTPVHSNAIAEAVQSLRTIQWSHVS
ncbi:zinc finger protein 37-like [Ptychodera flava]|uniref:zinc finger protein 37-like n=1 Tax=Ptychodera flava TaxID=63121 RepID=UPI00396A2747